jgi:hypothetical protein
MRGTRRAAPGAISSDDSGGATSEAGAGVGVEMIGPEPAAGGEVGARVGATASTVGTGGAVGAGGGAGEAVDVGSGIKVGVAAGGSTRVAPGVALDGRSGIVVDPALGVGVGVEVGELTTWTISVPWQPAISAPAISTARIHDSLPFIVTSASPTLAHSLVSYTP